MARESIRSEQSTGPSTEPERTQLEGAEGTGPAKSGELASVVSQGPASGTNEDKGQQSEVQKRGSGTAVCQVSLELLKGEVGWPQMTFQKNRVQWGKEEKRGRLGGALRLRRREHGLHSGEGRIQEKEGDSHRNHAGGTEVVGSGNGGCP